MVPPPFRVGEQVTGEFFTDRAEEVERILRALRHPTRLLVHGPRRQGKSSAIRQAAVRHGEDGGILIWVDVATAARLDDLTSRILAAIPPGWITLRKLLASLSIHVEARSGPNGDPVLGLALGRRAPEPARQEGDFRALIADLDALARTSGRLVALVLDEFQEIVEVAGTRGDWLLRDIMQTSHHLTFVCAGSATATIDRLLSQDGAFYRFFQTLAIGPMDPAHLATWIESRMASAGARPRPGVGADIVSLVGPRTQDCLELALEAYYEGLCRGEVAREDITAAALRIVGREEDRFRTVWSNLSRAQQAVLRAIALDAEAIYAEEVRVRHGLPSAATVQAAVRGLRKKRVLSEGRDGLVVDDPYLALWVRRRTTADGLPRTFPAEDS